VVLAWLADIGADQTTVNPRGGAIALGHPLGASGARLITTLIHELEDLDAELGFVTMCCAGGLATGTLLQRI
jgi:acetyl-CoA acetyltransferase